MKRILLPLALGAIVSAPALAATYWVGTNGNDANACTSSTAPCRTIQAAIDRTVGQDVVRVLPGTYQECFTAFFVDGGGFPVPSDITIVTDDFDLNNRNSTTILDATGLDCTLSSGGQTFFLPVADLGDGSILRGFTIKGNQGGGGVRGFGSVRITSNVIEGNTAVFGGGVYVYTGYYVTQASGTTRIDANTIRNNAADSGGGVFAFGRADGLESQIRIESNTIRNNRAGEATDGFGGGLYALSDTIADTDLSRIVISQNVIEGNQAVLVAGQAAYGGGVYATTYGNPALGSEVIEIQNNQVRTNSASGFGGGISAQILGTFAPASGPGYEVKVEDNSITNNVAAGGGGGLYMFLQNFDLDATVKANLQAKRNQISGNSHDGTIVDPFVPGGGGGVYVEALGIRTAAPNTFVRVEENTIQGNTAASVGGGASLYVLANSEPFSDGASSATTASVRFANNLVTGNAAARPGGGGEGGGVHVLAESVGLGAAGAEIEFNTVRMNNVDAGGSGGISVHAGTFPDTLANLGAAAIEVGDSIVVQNQEIEVGGTIVPGVANVALSVSFNDVWDTAGTLYGATIGDRTGQNGNVSVDPKLSTLHVPLLCSPTIDAADPTEGTFASDGKLSSEPQPNGRRANQGHLGNTANAVRTFPDVNGDQRVDGVDVLGIAVSFASTSSQPTRFNPKADRDGDGDVDGEDLSYIAGFYGQVCP